MTTKQDYRNDIATIRGWCIMNNVSFVELAFRAYGIYSDHKKRLERKHFQRAVLDVSPETEERLRHAGPYSFITLMSMKSKRWELVPFLHEAKHSLTISNKQMRKVK